MNSRALLLGLVVTASASLCVAQPTGQPVNVLRNGSFEGTLHYWYDTRNITLAAGDAPSGSRYIVFGDKARIRSTSLPIKTGQSVRIGFWARADTGTDEVRLGFHASQREIVQRVGGPTWGDVDRKKVGTSWEWVEFNVQAKGEVWPAWWQGQSYTLRIGADPGTMVDGVSVWIGEPRDASGPAILRKPVEAALAPVEPRPYVPAGGLYQPGETVAMSVTAFNGTDAAQAVTLRLELLDYEGRSRHGPVRWEKRVTIDPGASVVETTPLTLDARGLMLARLTVLDSAGNVIDSSDAPLTVLAFPKAATEPDPRERFGASMRGEHVSRLGQLIGFRYSRWSHGGDGWGNTEKTKGTLTWKDDRLAQLAEQGFTNHLVLWGAPEWATGKKGHHHLAQDMDWPVDDPRWDDLSIQTDFDRYVRAAVERFHGKGVVFELSNEPDLVFRNDPALAAKIHVRMARVVREAAPDAVIIYNCTWPTVSAHGLAFFEAGGANLIDVYSYHNYSPVYAATPQAIASMKGTLENYAPGRDIAIWFNEGWCHINSSRDDAQRVPIGTLTAEQAAHAAVRNSADVLAAGQDKIILFHIGYPQHGRSFWDAVGSGTELWEDDGTPTVMVAGWNTAADSLGLSEFVRTIRPAGARMHVFDDQRNGRGVIVAWATAEKDVTIELPLTEVIERDVVGVDRSVPSQQGRTQITLRRDGRPVYLFTAGNLPASSLVEAVAPLDEEKALADAGVILYRTPFPWTGPTLNGTDNNPARGDGVMPVWRFDQIHPADTTKSSNVRPMVWGGKNWIGAENSHGGQPSGDAGAASVTLSARGAGSGRPGKKIPALTFLVPTATDYVVSGAITTRRWEGSGNAELQVLVRRPDQPNARLVRKIPLTHGMKGVELPDVRLFIRPPEELIFAVVADDGSAWSVTLDELRLLEQPPARR